MYVQLQVFVAAECLGFVFGFLLGRVVWSYYTVYGSLNCDESNEILIMKRIYVFYASVVLCVKSNMSHREMKHEMLAKLHNVLYSGEGKFNDVATRTQSDKDYAHGPHLNFLAYMELSSYKRTNKV